jgi:hypothetical protein
MAGPVGWCSPDNHTCNFMSHPFVEAICRDEASTRFHRITKRMCCRRCFRSCVNHSRSARRVFRPCRNESPAHERQFTARFLRILPNDRHRLRRGNIVAGIPVRLIRDRIEILLNQLFSMRKSIATAHKKLFHIWQAASLPRQPLSLLDNFSPLEQNHIIANGKRKCMYL